VTPALDSRQAIVTQLDPRNRPGSQQKLLSLVAHRVEVMPVVDDRAAWQVLADPRMGGYSDVAGAEHA
jgi:hypothetical protein